ncbi:hypothetical protein CBD41_07540 [bacterium TMED181]|nr:hypothetical protein [Planctomycetota bacterium]OUW43212.1 MAG: hypothetical protein CBD41_07540 [bacterium TMED181]
MNSPDLHCLGDLDHALSVARRASEKVVAYRQFLETHDQPSLTSDLWSSIPTVDKSNYLLKHPFDDLLADDFSEAFTIFSSSGSSGRPFYWPQLKGHQSESAGRLLQFLEQTYRINEHSTMAIVGLALGSWIGGEHFSWALKSLAVQTPYPFAVFTPGSQHDEIIQMIKSAGRFVDRILLVLCPSAIGHLRLRADQLGMSLPHEKLRYLVIGEPFPEAVRQELQQLSNAPQEEPVMLSVFGSADTGVLGFESPASALIRGICHQDRNLAQQLGFSSGIPHLFHHADPSAFMETIDGELCVTRWQGIPLVRYNLHDSAQILSWQGIIEVLRENQHPAGEALAPTIGTLPDIVAVMGRSDSCLTLTGTNITESMLDEAIRSPKLSEWLSGNYRAEVVLSNGRQRLQLQLESKTEVIPSGDLIDQIYNILIETLGTAQPEFLDDWKNIYQRWDSDPELRILDLKFAPWPQLSEDQGIKHRGVQA